MSTICPGQDTRYWRPDDIFEIDCARCNTAVEFFKDDARRRCHQCGALIKNPKITLGCAQWCEHAKECLGYDPKEVAEETAEEASLLDQLVEAARGALTDAPERLARALSVTEEAEELLVDEEADRRVVLAASVLHPLRTDEDRVKQLLGELGLDSRTVTEVADLVAGNAHDTAEGRVIDDAQRLAQLREVLRSGEGQAVEATAFSTDTGRARAEKLLEASG